MFEIGDYIVYGQNGICQVEEITHLEMAGVDKDKLYYVLLPIKNPSGKLFCPADNTRVVMRKIVTKDEADAIIRDAKDIEPLNITNEKARDDSYKNTMKSCDIRETVSMLKTLLKRKKAREDLGKKITATDERYLKKAEEGIFSELSLATGYSIDEVKSMMLEYCGA